MTAYADLLLPDTTYLERHAAMSLLDAIVGDAAELVTVITGIDAVPSVTAQIEGWLHDHRGNVTVEVQPGGQPLYPYIFGVE